MEPPGGGGGTIRVTLKLNMWCLNNNANMLVSGPEHIWPLLDYSSSHG